MKTRLQLQNLTARRIPPANTSVSTGAASSLLCSFAHSQVLPRYYSARPQLSSGAIPRRGTGRCSCVGRPAAESLLHTQGARSQYHCRQISGEGRRTPQDDKTWDCYPGPTAPRVPLPPRPHTAPTAHLLERLHQFLFIVIIRDALDSGEGLPAVPLLDPYMDVVLSAGRKQGVEIIPGTSQIKCSLFFCYTWLCPLLASCVPPDPHGPRKTLKHPCLCVLCSATAANISMLSPQIPLKVQNSIIQVHTKKINYILVKTMTSPLEWLQVAPEGIQVVY